MRLHELFMDKDIALPPRRLASPTKRPSMQVRPRLNQYFTLDHAVALIKASQNIVVLTGAGISTSLGIPDFRSSTGVYSIVADSKYDDPQELFNIDNFKVDPDEFYKQAAKVFPKMLGLSSDTTETINAVDTKTNATLASPKYSLTHAFISLLDAKGKLLTNYTQNIDNLELAAGVPKSKMLQCHGTLATASCMTCGRQQPAAKYMQDVQKGKTIYCSCWEEHRAEQQKSRGRSGKKKRKFEEIEDSDSEEADFPKGLVKPDMTFFGEEVASSYAPRLEQDKMKVDLLIIIGTALKVEPVNELLLNIPPNVPQIWVSRDRCQREGVKVDIELLGDCDVIMEELARKAGWELALQKRLWSPYKRLQPAPQPVRNRERSTSTALSTSRNGSVAPPNKPGLERQRSSSKPETGGSLLADALGLRRIRSASARPDNHEQSSSGALQSGVVSDCGDDTGELEKAVPEVKKEKAELPVNDSRTSASPTKPQRPLQLRQKSSENNNLVVKAVSPVEIKINGEDVAPSENLPATIQPCEEQPDPGVENGSSQPHQQGEGRPTRATEEDNTTAAPGPPKPESHPGSLLVKPKQRVKSGTKVVIEQELGTRHRWFIKLAK
jgi:NAD-dependent SIR2 family protein deacetylase